MLAELDELGVQAPNVAKLGGAKLGKVCLRAQLVPCIATLLALYL